MTCDRMTAIDLTLETLRAAIVSLCEEAALNAANPLSSLPAREDLIDARLAVAGRDIAALAEAARILRRRG